MGRPDALGNNRAEDGLRGTDVGDDGDRGLEPADLAEQPPEVEEPLFRLQGAIAEEEPAVLRFGPISNPPR